MWNWQKVLSCTSVSQYNYVQRLQASLAALGFQLSPWEGNGACTCRADHTAYAAATRQPLEAFQEAMQRSTSQSSPEEEREHLAAALACRTAIRAGDPLSPVQMASLVEWSRTSAWPTPARMAARPT